MQAAPFNPQTWPDDVVQLLDDNHLVVLGRCAESRREFRHRLMQHLDGLPETEIVDIDGAVATNLASFWRQLHRQVAARRSNRRANGSAHDSGNLHSVIETLRHAASHPKRRYFIWHDAHAMLEADIDLFCRLVNAFFGVAAEFEHINADPLVVQRVVFIGSDKLGTYAENSHGQFCRWLDDDDDSPFWEVASVLDRPPVVTYRIDV